MRAQHGLRPPHRLDGMLTVGFYIHETFGSQVHSPLNVTPVTRAAVAETRRLIARKVIRPRGQQLPCSTRRLPVP
jgi:hypothetical protein